MDSNFIIEFDKSFELQSVEAIAKQLKSRGFLTEEESKLLSQFLLNKAKCDGQSVLKCAELVAELKDWRFSVKNSDTLSECIEACLKNELSSLQNGIDRVECRKSIVRFIGNLFKLQVLHQETFDSWKNFLEESNNIVLANYLTASVRPNSTDQGCAFMKATEKTVEPQMYCANIIKNMINYQLIILFLDLVMKHQNITRY